MADKSLYRITYSSGSVKYGNRKVLGPAVAYTRDSPGGAYRLGTILKIERVDEDSIPWEDCTGSFLGHPQ